MKYLTEEQLRELQDAANVPQTAADLEAAARRLVAQAGRLGYVLTIEQRPLQPLAMGHYETVASVREARQP